MDVHDPVFKLSNETRCEDPHEARKAHELCTRAIDEAYQLPFEILPGGVRPVIDECSGEIVIFRPHQSERILFVTDDE